MLTVRSERPSDADDIRAVITAAFPTDAEARLVDALRAAGRMTVSPKRVWMLRRLQKPPEEASASSCT